MSVSKRKNSPYYYYDFVIRGRRFTGSTKAKSKREAERVEREVKDRVKAEIKKVKRRIISRSYPGMGQEFEYCSSECGGYDQMAHEG